MNKKTKKRIIGLALVFALFAVIASGTLAYFTDETDVATNAFTVGKVQIRLSEGVVDKDGYSLDANTGSYAKDEAYNAYPDTDTTLWNAKGDKLADNRTTEGNNAKSAQVTGYDGNKYGYSLMPGKTVDKDPVVTVLQNSEESYVRVKVTLSHASDAFLPIFLAHAEDTEYTGGTSTSDIQAAIDAMTEFFVGYDKSAWEAVDAVVEDKALTVTFNYVKTATVAKNTEGNTNLVPIVKAITLPDWVTSKDAAKFETKDGEGNVTEVGFNVDIVAQAIQAAGFADADEAWDAFDGVVTEP